MRLPLSPLLALPTRTWLALPSALGLAFALACSTDVAENECQSDTDCESAGPEARCETNNYCTFADVACPNGRRWETDAEAQLGGACFDPSDLVPATGTGGSTSTSTGTSTSNGLTTSTSGEATTGFTTTDTTAADTSEGSSSGEAEAEGSESGGSSSGSGSSGESEGSEGASGSSSGDDGEPTLCDMLYGDLPGYERCESEDTRCSFSVLLSESDYRNCNGACNSIGDGWTCADALHNPEGGGCEPSEGDEQGACDEEAGDQICICEIE